MQFPICAILSHFCDRLQEKFGTNPEGFINITLSRQDLASLVGAAYETVFRIINELSQEQLIGLDGKQPVISDSRLSASLLRDHRSWQDEEPAPGRLVPIGYHPIHLTARDKCGSASPPNKQERIHPGASSSF